MITAALIAALIAVESGGNDLARGRASEVGALQITDVVRKDIYRITGQFYTPKDCEDRGTSIKICLVYLNFYCTRERLGRLPTDRDYATTWNAGPRGPWKYETLPYWKKVEAALFVESHPHHARL